MINDNQEEKVYIFVPLVYRHLAIELGAKYDAKTSSFYTFKSNKHYHQLIQIYNRDKFYVDYFGFHFK